MKLKSYTVYNYCMSSYLSPRTHHDKFYVHDITNNNVTLRYRGVTEIYKPTS